MNYYKKDDVDNILELNENRISDALTRHKLFDSLIPDEFNIRDLNYKALVELAHEIRKIDSFLASSLYEYAIMRESLLRLPIYGKLTVFNGYLKEENNGKKGQTS